MFDYPVVFVDIETTGGSYRNSRVLEVAAIRYENGQVTQEFSTLINPETYIPSQITSLTGIREADVIGAPVFADIAEELITLFDGAVFIAHNVRFDYSFLKNEFQLAGIDWSPRLLCTVRLSRALYPEHKRHNLATIIERHNINVTDRHRALEDTRAILQFSELAFQEHGAEKFQEAIGRQLKTQYMPPHLNMEELENIGNVPGVYIFKDENNQPVYVGKSVTLRKRVLSHFQSTLPKEVKISQNTHHVEVIPTGNELAALVLESKLVKELQPLFNRLLRRVNSYALFVKGETDGYATIAVKNGSLADQDDLSIIYGVYPSRMKAKVRLDEMTRTFELCPKLMGLEKASGACFSYRLGKCKGACIGEEPIDLYNRRFELALEHSRLHSWPYDSAIAIPLNDAGEHVIINNWMIEGYTDDNGDPIYDALSPQFDLDEYKIIRRFMREHASQIRALRYE